MPVTGTNAIDMLLDDHRTVERLFEEVEQPSVTPERRRQLIEQITKELSMHAAIEEQIFYPAVREALGADGKEIVRESLDDHQGVKEILAELEHLDAPGYMESVHLLISNVRRHVEEEEGEMFPRFRAAIDAKRLEEIGVALERAKKIAPTRPHPRAPSKPPGNVVAGVAAGTVDRVRNELDEPQRSAMKVAVKIVGGVALAVGAGLGVVKFVRSRRTEPQTRMQRLRGTAVGLGGRAAHVGGKAISIGGKAVAEGIGAVNSLRNRAS